MGRNAKHNFRDGLDHRIVAINSGSGRRWEVIINKNNYNIGNLWFFPRDLAEFSSLEKFLFLKAAKGGGARVGAGDSVSRRLCSPLSSQHRSNSEI